MATYGIDTERTFQVLIEASTTGVLVVDADGTIVAVNGDLECLFGYGPAELIGQGVELLLPEAQRPLHAAHRKEFARAPHAPPMGTRHELLGRRKDGSAIAVEIGLRPTETPDGLFVLASVVALSGSRRVQEAHRAALEEQLDFERFLAALSFQFIDLPAEQVVDAIRDGLRRVCEEFDLDRCSLVRIGPDDVLFDAVSWTAAGVPSGEAPLPAQTHVPWAIDRVLAGAVVSFSTIDDIPNEIDRSSFRALGTKSAVFVPLPVDGHVAAALGFVMLRAERAWAPDLVDQFTAIGTVFDQLLARQQRDDALQAAWQEMRRLKDQLQAENVYLRQEERDRLRLTRVIGQSAAVRRVLEQVRQVAATDSTVLLLGETGTGKELFATQIHELGPRHAGAMVRVNCAAIPATLIESELFGREKGAFTGALARQVGRFELADHSTIFLDEIGDLPLDVQVKLLRVLEERQIERLGSPRTIPVHTRIIAATHRNLEQRIVRGHVSGGSLLPAERVPDSRPGVAGARGGHSAAGLAVRGGVFEGVRKAHRLDRQGQPRRAAAVHLARQHPGTAQCRGTRDDRGQNRRLTIALPHAPPVPQRRSPKLADVEKEHIRTVLESTSWRIRGARGAAERLGLKPTTLETRMAKLGIRRQGH